MKRREFLGLLGGATAAWPLAARAQQTMPVVGFLHPGSPEASAGIVTAFRTGLAEAGFVDGRNVAFEFRWGQGDRERVPELAAELVRRRVAVIATPSNPVAALAAKALTSTIPIVFSMGGDPVEARLVASYNRPGGNVTGISSLNMEIASKRVELLHELLPKAVHFTLLINGTSPSAEAQNANFRAAVRAIGAQADIVVTPTIEHISQALAGAAEKVAGALIVSPGFPFNQYRAQTARLATQHKIPTVYATREWTAAGGLMSYGPILSDEFREAGIYTGRILKGEKPADLPVMRPTKFEFVFNLKAAKTLGLTVPPLILTRADEVIE